MCLQYILVIFTWAPMYEGGSRTKVTKLCLNLCYNKTVTLKCELSRPVGCDIQGPNVMTL